MYKRLNSLGILPWDGLPVYPATFDAAITCNWIKFWLLLTIVLVISTLADIVDDGVLDVKLSPINALADSLDPVDVYNAKVRPPVALKTQLNCASNT